MQISEAWLREYVNPPISTQELVAQLTMAGLEIDATTPAAAVFNHVVVGQVLTTEQHPDADRLKVCQVEIGAEQPLQIVCGATNVRPGLKIPAALIGAELPGDFKIKRSKLRGVESMGMLCSAKELGLAQDAQGLLELPEDAPIGVDIRDYLALNDTLIELDLTPNRADCLSMEGIARELAVLNRMAWTPTQFTAHTATHADVITVNVETASACPRYLGRLIKDVNAKAETPIWMQERLRRSGLRSLGPLIDVTNYVLIELGQPLHAFDADKLHQGISVRKAQPGEQLALLNGQTITLDSDTLVIADQKNPLALAGVMGGSDSAVSDETRTIFLECAFFTPQEIAGKARRYGLHTDSSHRFERGVDPSLQTRAIERATQLIVDIAGGNVGPIIEQTSATHLPVRPTISLRKTRLAKLLGVTIEDALVEDILQRLGMSVEAKADSWSVTAPGVRFDIAIEADLIEEIARIYGYNQLPKSSSLMHSELQPATESVLELTRVADTLVDRGYQETITYSFVDEAIQKAIAPDAELIRLQNPISSELSIMRTSLWCGLLKAALYNLNRQQNRIRLFETGLRFIKENNETLQQKAIAGLITGNTYPEQWGLTSKPADFYDIKADVQALFALTGVKVTYLPDTHPALHPGQTAKITNAAGETIGFLGMLHPVLEKQLGFDNRVFLFELDQNLLLNKQLPRFKPLSKFPSVRRDLALIVKETISAQQIVACIHNINEPILQDVVIFDVYRGKGVAEDSKSIALGLFLQNDNQTLTDSEIDAIVNRVLENLTNKISAKLRD